MNRVAASYFDGRSTRRQAAELQFDGDEVIARGDFGECRAALRALHVSEAMGSAPRFVRFPDGKTFEVADLQRLADCLLVNGLHASPVVQLQRRWSSTLGALLATVALLAAVYAWGLPALSGFLAPRLPASAVESLSSNTLAMLDARFLKPSQLPQARRDALLAHLHDVLARRADLPAYRLSFRAAPGGANAFALPGGEVILLDGLVELAQNDDEIAGVVAHELGHVAYRHGLRQLIQSSIVSFVMGVYLGDVSSLAAGMGTLLLESRYSRRFELEADAYAAQTLALTGRGVEPLVTMLQKLEGASAGQQAASSGLDWLSSHPETGERIDHLRSLGGKR